MRSRTAGVLVGARARCALEVHLERPRHGAARERFIDAASPILRRAAIDLNASVELHLDSGGLIRCIDQGFWPMAGRSDQASQRVGTIATPHASAAGKAVLAHRADIDAIELAPITSHTITERHELEAQLERIRASGIAWERDEVSLGVSAVAVPCRTEHGDLMAVSVTESSDSFRERADQIVPVLLGVRDELAA